MEVTEGVTACSVGWLSQEPSNSTPVTGRDDTPGRKAAKIVRARERDFRDANREPDLIGWQGRNRGRLRPGVPWLHPPMGRRNLRQRHPAMTAYPARVKGASSPRRSRTVKSRLVV